MAFVVCSSILSSRPWSLEKEREESNGYLDGGLRLCARPYALYTLFREIATPVGQLGLELPKASWPEPGPGPSPGEGMPPLPYTFVGRWCEILPRCVSVGEG